VLLTVTVSAAVEPAQVVVELIVATGSGSTVIVSLVEFNAAHTPLCTNARYNVVVVRFKYGCVVVVFAISIQLAPVLIEYCHFTTEPVLPLKVMLAPLFPLHTVVFETPPDKVVPGTVVWFTVNVATLVAPINDWKHEVVEFVILFKVTVGLPAANVFVVMDTVLGPVPVTVVADEPVTV
jgi:hypothetical protein